MFKIAIGILLALWAVGVNIEPLPLVFIIIGHVLTSWVLADTEDEELWVLVDTKDEEL